METINGQWYMQGCNADDPNCIHSSEELLKLIRKNGFLPLFANEIPGFSVEERTVPQDWWSGDPETDPWEWRIILSRHKDIAYGKFFNKKPATSQENGSRSLPIIDGMDMILKPCLVTNWHLIARRRL